MNDFLIMRSFDSNQRVPTVDKVRRDGIRMYSEARYVIVLNEEGDVVERINRSITWMGNYLVVLAPVLYDGWKINLSVVLEIGLSRSVPYQQFEKKIDGKTVATKNRRPIVKFTDTKIISLTSILSQSLKTIALEETKHWKSVEYGGKRKQVGRRISWKSSIFASIPHDEEILCYAVYLSDLETRFRYLKEKVRFIKFWLKKYQFSYYSRKQLRSFAGAQKVAELLINAKYPTHHLHIILNNLSHKHRELVELSVRAFSPETEEYKELDEILKTPTAPSFYIFLHSRLKMLRNEIKNGWKLHGYVWEKRDANRKVHAQNSLRFEIGLEGRDRIIHYQS